jgi:hypothetical protein
VDEQPGGVPCRGRAESGFCGSITGWGPLQAELRQAARATPAPGPCHEPRVSAPPPLPFHVSGWQPTGAFTPLLSGHPRVHSRGGCVRGRLWRGQAEALPPGQRHGLARRRAHIPGAGHAARWPRRPHAAGQGAQAHASMWCRLGRKGEQVDGRGGEAKGMRKRLVGRSKRLSRQYLPATSL